MKKLSLKSKTSYLFSSKGVTYKKDRGTSYFLEDFELYLMKLENLGTINSFTIEKIGGKENELACIIDNKQSITFDFSEISQEHIITAFNSLYILLKPLIKSITIKDTHAYDTYTLFLEIISTYITYDIKANIVTQSKSARNLQESIILKVTPNEDNKLVIYDITSNIILRTQASELYLQNLDCYYLNIVDNPDFEIISITKNSNIKKIRFQDETVINKLYIDETSEYNPVYVKIKEFYLAKDEFALYADHYIDKIIIQNQNSPKLSIYKSFRDTLEIKNCANLEVQIPYYENHLQYIKFDHIIKLLEIGLSDIILLVNFIEVPLVAKEVKISISYRQSITEYEITRFKKAFARVNNQKIGKIGLNKITIITTLIDNDILTDTPQQILEGYKTALKDAFVEDANVLIEFY